MKRDPKLRLSMAEIPAEGMKITRCLTPTELEMDDLIGIVFKDPIAIDITAKHIVGGAIIQGTLSASYSADCDKCLGVYNRDIQVDDFCIFRENNDNEIIDLTDHIREDILIGLPQNMICGENCQGLCSDCGANLNKEGCSCQHDNVQEGSVWDSLDQLDI